MKFLLCDFHGTIVDSNKAWIQAYIDLGVQNYDQLERQIFQKQSRKEMAAEYGLDFDLLMQHYRKNLHIREETISFIHQIHGKKNIIIISNSQREKLQKDIKQVATEHDLEFSFIYSKEDGCKNDKDFIDNLCKKHKISTAYMIGNDIREDLILNENIINIFIPYKKSLILNKKV